MLDGHTGIGHVQKCCLLILWLFGPSPVSQFAAKCQEPQPALSYLRPNTPAVPNKCHPRGAWALPNWLHFHIATAPWSPVHRASTPQENTQHAPQPPLHISHPPPSCSILTSSQPKTQPRNEKTPCFRIKTPEEQVWGSFSFSNASPITPCPSVARSKLQPLECILVIKDIWV